MSEAARELYAEWGHKNDSDETLGNGSGWNEEGMVEFAVAYHASQMSGIAQRAAEKILKAVFASDQPFTKETIAAIIEQEAK
jgi:hypothetical protein